MNWSAPDLEPTAVIFGPTAASSQHARLSQKKEGEREGKEARTKGRGKKTDKEREEKETKKD